MVHAEQKKIGIFLSSLRQEQGLTQKEFAKRMKTSQSAVARMEAGEQNFSLLMLGKISKVLHRNVLTLSETGVNLVISGGQKLSGSITTNSSKNAAMTLLAASLLNKGTTLLKDVPRIEEVHRIIEVLRSIGVSLVWKDRSLLIRPPQKILIEKLQKNSAEKTRSILLFLGPLIHFFPHFKLPHSGGCQLGKRSVKPHFFALEKFGVNIKTLSEEYEIKVRLKPPKEIILYEAGDTVTENAIMAAAKIPEKTIIRFASANYQVQELCFFLEKLGVRIQGIGTTTLLVIGKKDIEKDIEYPLSEDPIESMLFLTAGILTGGTLTVKRCPIDFLLLELLKLEKMGLRYSCGHEYFSKNGKTRLCDITVKPSKLVALGADDKIHPAPYPGLNIDNLPYFTVIATQAKGRTLIHDWVYEKRALYYTELTRLGADVTLADPHRVFIEGPTPLRGAEMICPPALRAGAILLLAMLAATGKSILRNNYTIARGYENLAARLNSIGAKIHVLDEM